MPVRPRGESDCGDMSTTASTAEHFRYFLAVWPPFLAMPRVVECELIRQRFPLAAPVLDLGCGDGHFACRVFDAPVYAGVDSNARKLEEARNKQVYENLLLEDADSLSIAAHSVGTVIANSVLEHIEHIEPVLTELKRVLIPGGQLIMTAPSEKFADFLFGSSLLRLFGLKKLSENYGHWFNHKSRHYRTDSLGTWRARLAEHGFVVEEGFYYFGPKAHRVFDLLHYASITRLLSYKITGRWVLWPPLSLNRLYEKLLSLCSSAKLESGAYVFLRCRSR